MCIGNNTEEAAAASGLERHRGEAALVLPSAFGAEDLMLQTTTSHFQ